MNYTKLVPRPSPFSINTQTGPCPTSLLLRKFGWPIHYEKITDQCQMNCTNQFWKTRMITDSVGPFRITGHRILIEHLKPALEQLKHLDLELYNSLGTAGALCIRWVRGNPGILSNHGLGLAIDFTIDNKLDARGDNMCQSGLLLLYGVLKQYGFYWGAGFRIEDSMHFEIGYETIMSHLKNNTF